MEFIRRQLRSRKFWAFSVAFVTLLFGALADSVITSQEGLNLTLAALGYIASVAYEDGEQAKAAATVTAANMQANTTTVTTPGTSDVQVVATEPAKPFVAGDGLR